MYSPFNFLVPYLLLETKFLCVHSYKELFSYLHYSLKLACFKKWKVVYDKGKVKSVKSNRQDVYEDILNVSSS